MKKSLLIAIISFMLVGFTSCGNEGANEKERQEFLNTIVTQTNNLCPLEFGNWMSIVKVEALPGYKAKVHCVLYNMSPELCASIDMDQAKAGATAGIKSDPVFEQIKKNQISYLYEYRNENGEFLYDVLVTPEDYK